MSGAPQPIVVLHDLGAPRGGAPWREALAAATWNGPVIAPDLPGHGGTPAPVGGTYEGGDALLAILPLLRDVADAAPAPIVVGCGTNGWAAQLLALAGRASALVLVDGLGGPWRTPAEQIDEGRSWLRRIADDPAAIGPAPATGLDPRAAHGVPAHGSRRLALKAAAAMPVPTLLVETPASALTSDEVEEVAVAFGQGATVQRLTTADVASVVDAIVGHREPALARTSR